MELTYHLSLLTASMVCNLIFIGIGIAEPLIGAVWIAEFRADARC